MFVFQVHICTYVYIYMYVYIYILGLSIPQEFEATNKTT